MFTILITVVVSLVLSAFFSGMEIAFLSSNRLKLEIEKKQNRWFSYIASLFDRYPGQYITTILVGNNIALVVYSLQMSVLIRLLLDHFGVLPVEGISYLIETLISTLIIIFSAEFIPKTIVRLNPNFYYQSFAVPVYLFYLLFYPITMLTTLVSTGLFRLLGMPLQRRSPLGRFNRTDLAHLLDEASEDPQQQKNGKDIRLFQNALDFSQRQVRDCMVPRVDIEAVDCNLSIEEATKRMIDTRFSRLLVYRNNIDDIIGFVHTKSLFRQPHTILEILNKVEYVPESMPTRKLLTQLIKSHHSVAVVIDEFGGTAGMVTTEDILEEIFGEIEDEHDSQDLVEKRLGSNEYLFSGRLEIETINEKYHLHLPESNEYDTLAGYVIARYEGIPEVGESLQTDNLRIKVLRVNASKIELVRITVL